MPVQYPRDPHVRCARCARCAELTSAVRGRAAQLSNGPIIDASNLHSECASKRKRETPGDTLPSQMTREFLHVKPITFSIFKKNLIFF